MVRIVDGEIVQDNDASGHMSSSRHHQPSSSTTDPQSRQRRTGSGFDRNAPMFRIVEPLDGEGLMGMRDVEVYGVRINTRIALVVGLAFLLFGWRGLLCGALLWMLWVSSGNGAQPGARGMGYFSEAVKKYVEEPLGSQSRQGGANTSSVEEKRQGAFCGTGRVLGSS